jgi:tetratricopeptide (TPR) repeat protein
MNNTLIKFLRVYILRDAELSTLTKWDRRIAMQPEVENLEQYLRDQCNRNGAEYLLDTYQKMAKEWPNDPIMYFNVAIVCIVCCKELEYAYMTSDPDSMRVPPYFIVDETEFMDGKQITFRDFFNMRSTAVSSLRKIMELEPELPLEIVACILAHISDLCQPKRWEWELGRRGWDLHCCLASKLEATGNIAEAIKEYRVANHLGPSYGLVHQHLGDIYKERGEFDQAIVEYQELIRVCGDGYELLAGLYEQCGKLNEVVVENEKISRLAPQKADAHLMLEALYTRQNRLDLAAQEHQEASKLDNRAAERHCRFASYFDPLDEFEKAVQEYQAALQIDPFYVEALVGLGICYLKRQMWEEANRRFRKALEADKNHISAIYHLALVLEEAGQYHESSVHWKTYARLSSDSPAYKFCKVLAERHIKNIENKL